MKQLKELSVEEEGAKVLQDLETLEFLGFTPRDIELSIGQAPEKIQESVATGYALLGIPPESN